MENLTLEQKIIKYLADKGYITNVGDVTQALKDFTYAEKMITGNDSPGIKDDIKVEIESGNLEDIVPECDHKSLTNEEIQVVFDNDEEESSK